MTDLIAWALLLGAALFILAFIGGALRNGGTGDGEGGE